MIEDPLMGGKDQVTEDILSLVKQKTMVVLELPIFRYLELKSKLTNLVFCHVLLSTVLQPSALSKPENSFQAVKFVFKARQLRNNISNMTI